MGLIALLLLSALAEGQQGKLDLPLMRGMKSTKKVPLSEAMEKSGLCDMAKMGPELAASMTDEADFKVYKTDKSVAEVIDFYKDFAAGNGMPDVRPSFWDNSAGKQGEDKPRDSSGTITFAFDFEKARIAVTVTAYRAAGDKKTTVYVFLPQSEKKK